MHIDIAVVSESSGDRQAGGERTAEAVDKHIYLFALVLGEFAVDSGAVEVVASDVAFQGYVVSGFRHGKTKFATKLPLYKRRVKDTKSRRNFVTLHYKIKQILRLWQPYKHPKLRM